MENSGLPDKIQITLKSYQLLARYPEFKCSPRGGVRIDVRLWPFLQFNNNPFPKQKKKKAERNDVCEKIEKS